MLPSFKASTTTTNKILTGDFVVCWAIRILNKTETIKVIQYFICDIAITDAVFKEILQQFNWYNGNLQTDKI